MSPKIISESLSADIFTVTFRAWSKFHVSVNFYSEVMANFTYKKLIKKSGIRKKASSEF